MKCLIIIPSKGRPNNILKNTLPLVKKIGLDYCVLVEPQDADKYRCDNLIVLPENNKGLGYSTTHAKTYAQKNNYELVFRIDDDVTGIGQIEKDIYKILEAFTIKKVGAIVFPYDFEFYAVTQKLFSRKNKRCQTCYIIRTNLFRPNVNVSTFDDFYQYLLLRNDGYDTLFCSRHAIKCSPVGSGQQGLQFFDRSLLARKEIEIFRKIDPKIGIVHKPDKPWKYEPKLSADIYKSSKI